MNRLVLALILAIGLTCSNFAHAQNRTCSTAPLGDNSNRCASTEFVQRNGGGASPHSIVAADCGAVAGTNTAPVRAANKTAIETCWTLYPDIGVPEGDFYTDAVTAPSTARSITGISPIKSRIIGVLTSGTLLTNSNAAPFYVYRMGFEAPYGDSDNVVTIGLTNITQGGIYYSRLSGFRPIGVSSVSNFDIIGNYFDKWHWGILYGGMSHSRFSFNTINDFSGTSSNTFHAVTLTGGTGDVQINANNFGHVPNVAIEFAPTGGDLGNVQIVGNQIDGFEGEKIRLESRTGSNISDFIVSFNTVNYTAAGGGNDFCMDFENTSGGSITDGSVVGNQCIESGYAFFVGGNAAGDVKNIIFSNNHCIDTGVAVVPNGAPAWFGACFQLSNGANHNTFVSNQMSNSLGTLTAWVWEVLGATDNFVIGNSGTPGTTSNYVFNTGNTKSIGLDKSYQNNTSTSPQFSIEQDGTGDAQLQWLLTGGQSWVAGIDNSDSDKWKLAYANDAFASSILAITGSNTQPVFRFSSLLLNAAAGPRLEIGASPSTKFATIYGSLVDGSGPTSGDVIIAGGFGGTTDYWKIVGSTGNLVPATSGTRSVGNSSTGIANLFIGGTSSGIIGVKGAAASGTWTLTLPTTGGNASEALITDGSGVTSWAPISLMAAHSATTGTVPIVGSGAGDCGTSPAIAGNDGAGRVTVGSSTNGGKCTVTFNATWTHAPICSANNETSAALLRTANVSTTAMELTGTLTAADKLSYRCVDYQ